MMNSITQFVSSLPLLWAAVLASLIAGLAAGIGALPVFFVNRASRRPTVQMLREQCLTP